MHRKLIVACGVSLSWLLLAPSAAKACSCRDVIYPKMSQKKLARLVVNIALRQSEVVFSGEVIQIVAPNIPTDDAEVKFNVRESWKGELGEDVSIFTAVMCCVCGYPFKVGESYLVYARRVDDRLVTDECTRTAKVANAKKDLQVLGKGRVADKRGVAFLRWAKHNKAFQLTAR